MTPAWANRIPAYEHHGGRARAMDAHAWGSRADRKAMRFHAPYELAGRGEMTLAYFLLGKTAMCHSGVSGTQMAGFPGFPGVSRGFLAVLVVAHVRDAHGNICRKFLASGFPPDVQPSFKIKKPKLDMHCPIAGSVSRPHA